MTDVIYKIALVAALFFATQAAVAQDTDDGAPEPETPEYGISLNPATDKVFASAIVGYDAQKAHSVTINNTGNQPTGQLIIALTGTHWEDFSLSETSITDILPGETDSFTVVPNTDLDIGTYSATVTVLGDNDISETFDVSFTVVPVPPVPVFFGLANTYKAGDPVVPLKVIGEGSATLTVFKVTGTTTTETNEFNPATAGAYLIEALSANGKLRIWKYVKVN
jgi:hypothetical protein